MKKFYFLMGMVLCSAGLWAQVSLTNGTPTALIDFSNTTPTGVGSNPSTAFAGAGFEPATVTAGRLNSNAWATTGFSDFTLAFGGTITTGDHARGATAVAVTTGGIFAYTGAPGSVANPTLMIQPGATDFTPGTLTLRIQNNGTTNITQLAVSYNLYIRNDQTYSNTFNFSYSSDNVTYTPVGALDYTSPAAVDALGWVIVGTAPSRSTTITGLAITPGSYVYIRWSGDDVPGAGSRDEFGLDDINMTATYSAGGTPDIVLNSGNPAVPVGNITQGSTNNVIYQFDLAVTTADAVLNGVTINTLGTYTAADITNFKCWYSTDAVFSAGTDVVLSTLAPVAIAGPQVFPAFVNQLITTGATGYFFITADLPCSATLANDISVDAITTADISFVSGNKSGTAFAGSLQTIIAAIPVDVTVPAASPGNTVAYLTWVNPAGCYDEVLIVARDGVANDGVPVGDGTAYTPNLAFGTGTALGNGFVVYKGNASGQTVTNLVNGTTYFYKFFTRKGTNWSTGIEVSAIPAVVTAPSDHFRSVTPGGDWGNITTWETSPDNGTTPWIPATLAPTNAANTILIRNTANVTVAAAASGDQVTVEAGATLTLGADFTLANGTGVDLIVDGTVINSAGTHVFTGTSQFNVNTLYQHNRNGSPLPQGTWDVTSTVEINGITTFQPTGLGQTFGNFTWNSPLQSQNIGLGSPVGFAIAGNLTVTSTGGVTNRAFRFTSNTAYTLSVGGNLVMNGGHMGLTSGTGTMDLTVAGDVTISNNSELYLGQGGSAIGTINIAGNLSVNTATITETGSATGYLVVFNKVGTQTFSATAAVLANNINYTVAATSTLVLNNDLPVNNVGRLVTVDGIMDYGILSVTGAGAVVVNNGGRVRLGSLNATDAVANNIAATGGVTLNTGSTVEFNGLAAQFAAARTFSNAVINNAAGLTLTGPVLVNGVLGLTSGIITTTAANLLTLESTASYTGGNSNASFISGPIRKIGNTDFLFPVGKTGIGYIPIGITSFIGTLDPLTDAFTAEYNRVNPRPLGPIGPLIAPFIDHISQCDYWMLDRSSGTPDVNVTGYWNANNLSCGPYVDDVTSVELVRFDGTEWSSSSFGVSVKNGTVAAGDVTWTAGVTAFGPIALASSNALNPLPITINYFNGAKQNGNHLLNWKVTCFNTPNATLELERSTDGRNYSSIYSIYATALRCQQPFDHTDITPAKGTNYYRLKMTDADGKVTYSSIVHLINAVKGMDILNISPNPIVNGNFNVKISAAEKTQMELLITDMQGRVLQKINADLIAGFNAIPVNVRSLAAGTYQLYGNTADGRTRVLRFVIQ